MKIIKIHSLLVSAIFCLFTASAHAAFDSVFFIGDSLSDAGNLQTFVGNETPPWPLIPDQAYSPSNTFTNGSVWAETFSTGLGFAHGPSENFGNNGAWAGARTGRATNLLLEAPGGLDQSDGWINFFVSNFGGISPASLWVVWVGGNDVRDAADLADPTLAAQMITDAVDNIGTIITDLNNVGAQNFFIPNVSDVGGTPESLMAGAAFAQNASDLTVSFNDQLANSLSGLRATLNVSITELDVYAGNQAILADPAAFGFTNTTGTCLEIGGAGVCANPDEYLYWDGTHPTAAAHAIIGQSALAVIPIPAALPLMLSALVFLRVIRRA